MGSTFPSILVIPGAWHPSSLYKGLADELEQTGFPTSTANLPSLNSAEPENATCVADSDSIRETLSALIEKEGKDVILLAHSYGGIPGGAAARGLSRQESGKISGVVGLIYLVGFVVPEGQSLVEYLGGKNAPYVVEDNVSSLLTTYSPFDCGLITMILWDSLPKTSQLSQALGTYSTMT